MDMRLERGGGGGRCEIGGEMEVVVDMRLERGGGGGGCETEGEMEVVVDVRLEGWWAIELRSTLFSQSVGRRIEGEMVRRISFSPGFTFTVQ